ncbi:MAG TPA: hypothetical protein VMR52_14190 [Dehalococcoidia bacterium]|nr:hypothetical protein [Dehalococcoidia bacterium]
MQTKTPTRKKMSTTVTTDDGSEESDDDGERRDCPEKDGLDEESTIETSTA